MTQPPTPTNRPFVNILMACCNIYTRVLMTADKKAYAGHCPRCAKPVRLEIVAQGGKTGRFFIAE